MFTNPLTLVHLTGLLAILGVLCYAIGDVLMLAMKANIADYPNLQPHLKLLSGTEHMVALPWWRLAGGGLIGVLITPVLVAGLWHLYYGLAPAGDGSAWPPVLLFAVGFILAPFVHGSFIYLSEYVEALNRVSPEARAVILGMFKRHKQVLAVSYGLLALSILIASIWFSVVVGLGGTRFPQWLAAVNPITALVLWLVIRRLLPRLTAHVEGAGFNIAFLMFFALTTITLW